MNRQAALFVLATVATLVIPIADAATFVCPANEVCAGVGMRSYEGGGIDGNGGGFCVKVSVTAGAEHNNEQCFGHPLCPNQWPAYICLTRGIPDVELDDILP